MCDLKANTLIVEGSIKVSCAAECQAMCQQDDCCEVSNGDFQLDELIFVFKKMNELFTFVASSSLTTRQPKVVACETLFQKHDLFHLGISVA